MILAVAAFAFVWNSRPFRLKDHFVARHFFTVDPNGLFRSGQISRWMIERTLTEHRIELIVDLTVPQPGHLDQGAERAAAAALGIERCNFELNGDGTGRVENFAAAVEAIAHARAKDRRVLVHCAAGDRRTGVVVFLYELLVQAIPLERAREELNRFAHSSNGGSDATRFLDSHLGDIARELVARGVIASAPDPLPCLVSPKR